MERSEWKYFNHDDEEYAAALDEYALSLEGQLAEVPRLVSVDWSMNDESDTEIVDPKTKHRIEWETHLYRLDG